MLLSQRLVVTLALAGAAFAAFAAHARAKPFIPGQVVITQKGSRQARVVETKSGESVAAAVDRLDDKAGVTSASPNYKVHATAFMPNDPGMFGVPGGWAQTQWNFTQIAAPAAWEKLNSLGVGGATGTTIAVIDTGVAGFNASTSTLTKPRPSFQFCRYTLGASVKACLQRCQGMVKASKRHKRHGRKGVKPRRPQRPRWPKMTAHECKFVTTSIPSGPERMAPDWSPDRFATGHDFIDGDSVPYDENGHGTHVAGTIGESTNNGVGFAGLAYQAKIMPVRVLGADGSGDSADLANGITWAVDHGADVINLSLGFPLGVGANEAPEVAAALQYAEDHGVVVAAAAGNDGVERIGFPANYAPVISVAATTPMDTLVSYSDWSNQLDMAAPGGDASSLIYQEGLLSAGPDGYLFGEVGMAGTSMATPHVSAVAAMIIAKARAQGQELSPAQVRLTLATSATCGVSLVNHQNYRARYGHCVGLNAAAALSG